jgi:hypothetical protein
MTLIVAVTGAVGFLASFALLYAGVNALWLRYPVAVATAYAAFLFFLWSWLRLRRDDRFDGLDIPIPNSSPSASVDSTLQFPDKPFQPGGGVFGGGGASGFSGKAPEVAGWPSKTVAGSSAETPGVADVAGLLPLEELAAVILAIVALVGAALAALWIIWAAPALLAELLLDATLAAGLYRRLRGVQGDHWLRTAVGRTGWPFIVVGVLFALAGAAMQAYAPGAKSIGQVIQYHNEAR